jgi:benzil reductase ((S)-benzoin forming)
MNYFFITGTSRGIGNALTKLLLESENNFVYGFSRSNEVSFENFKHIGFDLSNLNEVKEYEFPALNDSDSIVLVNNSAAISEITHLGKISSDNIIDVYSVNIVSPSVLMNSFLRKYQSYNCKRMIMNISSGAAYKPIESWTIYCASKSALAMISEITDIEQKLKHPENPVHIFSVGPGVVDTKMQTELRKVSPEDFSMVGMFIDYFEKNELAQPKDVALKLYKIMKNPEIFDKVALTIKDIG